MEDCNNLNDGDLNPIVQIELERLNTTSAQINEFENKLQDLRTVFHQSLSKFSTNLAEISNKVGSAIPRARLYFDLKREQIEMQRESQMAASRYETACVEYKHANTVVSKSESSAKGTTRLDDSAMEILNIAIVKVNLARKEMNEAHREHQKYLSSFMELEKQIHIEERRHKSDIKKSWEYFHYSKYMDDKLKEDKLNIEAYEEKVRICKSVYNTSLQRLEDLSNKIHKERKRKELLGPRGEGVGAEVDNIIDEGDYENMYKSEDACSGVVAPLQRHIALSKNNSNWGSSTSTLASSTLNVDRLGRTVLDNQTSFHYGTNKHSCHTPHRDCPVSATSTELSSFESHLLGFEIIQNSSVNEIRDNYEF